MTSRFHDVAVITSSANIQKSDALSVAAQAQNLVVAIIIFIQFIGYIACFRGVLILN